MNVKITEDNQKKVSEMLDKVGLLYTERFKDNFIRNRELFEYRAGVNNTYHTLEETAKEFNLTKERVKQIEYKIIEQMIAVAGEAKKIEEILNYMPYKREIK